MLLLLTTKTRKEITGTVTYINDINVLSTCAGWEHFYFDLNSSIDLK